MTLKVLSRCLATSFALLLAAPAGAEPPWWEGAPEDVPAAAAQTGKPVILYFQSPNAAECVRMDEETWSPMNPVWADLQFIWLKLEPRKDADFFKHWQINQVPQVVILDSDMRDQLRLRGFMTLGEIEDALSRVERSVPTVFTTVSGGTVPARNPILDLEQLRRDPNKGHIYFEDFDKYKLIGSLSNPPFSPVIQASSRINTSKGSNRSACLEVSSGSQDVALLQIDVSQRFSEVEQVLGRIRVRAKLKSESRLGSIPVDVMALYLVREDDPDGDDSEQMYFASLSDKDINIWRDKEIVSAPVNLRLYKAFILLSAPSPGTTFLADDIVADLIPADDLIPFVDTDSRVQTIAAYEGDGSTGGAGDTPDSFYESLSARARVVEPASVSNTVTQPDDTQAAPQVAPRVGGDAKVSLTAEEIRQVAMHVKDMTPKERVAYYSGRRINTEDRMKLTLVLREMGVK